MPRIGGRPRRIETDDIVRVGRELGLRQLSLNAVADRLGVSSAALYRHVDGRWGLERLVGESILADVQLVDDPADDAAAHLVSFGLQLRAALLGSPGLSAYVQTLFPRGGSGRRLLLTEVAALGRRGYSPDAAIVLSSAVASMAIGYAAAEDLQRQHAEDWSAQERRAADELRTDPLLGEAHRLLPAFDADEYVRRWLGAAVRGFVEAAPPGRSAQEIWAALDAAGKGE